VSWELADEKMDDGEPFSIHQRYTFSLHEKAKLRADLESWRGKSFDEQELEAFDLEVLLGKPCLVTIVHEAGGNGKTYANVKSVAKLPKNMPAPSAPANVPHSFTLASPDWSVFDGLSDGLKDTIRKSPEYQQVRGEGQPAAQTKMADSDIPF
jgi:hypothetical protein